jgi:hypothetical protein
VLDEQRIEGHPVPFGDDLPEPFLGLLGRTGPYDPEPVRDPVHVGVDRDRGDPVAEDEDAVGGLRTDVGQREELFHAPRHHALEAIEDLARAVPDRARLGPVETGLPDQRLDRVWRGGRQSAGVRIPGEQSSARDVRRFVARTLGEDRADQHLERVLRVVPQVRNAPIPPVVQLGQAVHEQLPVERGPVGHRSLPVPSGEPEGVGYAPTPGSERSGSSAAPWLDRSSSPIR